MPHNNNFVDISRIPDIKESAQDVEYKISVQDDPKMVGFFPLLVTKTKSDAKIEAILVKFNKVKYVYELPKVY